ncbi:MAG TPA: 16S rRNA (cytidine(1402)-2'-O)-methyltransferase [Steroidobacteraceae bacterium]|nr:16S rRNA (cytidine(1402)-2'-O)-methyltransferase [Steroidobacteraceae bacterium]
MGNQPGRLEVVATPIGNMGDLSARAREALAGADLIAAEDTRRTLGLLQQLGIAKPLLSLHAHNETQRLPELLARLKQGARVVLVSDAGTPLLSDPGFELLRAAVAQGTEIGVVPGPSAITAALALAALPVDRFCFEGFLPAAGRERRARLGAVAGETRTMVFFEAPHRIAESLVDLSTVLGGERPAVIARELTKLHESVYRGTLEQLCQLAQQEPNLQRGEITLVVQGAAAVENGADMALMRRALELLVPELPPGKAAAIAAQLAGGRRADAYELAMQLRGEYGDR